MDATELEEYENHQNEICHRLSKLLARNRKHSWKEFFPEFEIEGVCTNAFMNNTWKLQLPFYDAVILPVLPEKEEDFEERYDCSTETMIELNKKGKIFFLLGARPLAFAGLHYLDPILGLDPPVFADRKMVYHLCLLGQHILQQRIANFQSLCKSRNYRKLIRTIERVGARLPEVDWGTQLRLRLTDLYLSGYGKLVSRLVKCKSPSEFVHFSVMTHRILIELEMMSIDGVICVDKEDLSWTRALSKFKKINKDIDVFPYDVGQLLIKELKLMRVDNLEIDEILEISKNTFKARRALLELDKATAILMMENILDRTQALESVWLESNEVVESMIKKERAASALFLVSIGIIGGAIGSVGGTNGIIASILGSVATSVPLVKRASETLAKIKKPGHVLALFDLRKAETQKNL